MNLDDKKIKNILIFRLGGIGDIVIITPALRAIRQTYPNAHICFICEGAPAQLLSECPWIDEIIVETELFRCQNYLRFLMPDYISKLWKLFRKIREIKYDLFIEFHGLYNFSSIFKPMLAAIASNAPLRLGFNNKNRGFFLTEKIPDDRFENKHLILRYNRILKSIGIENNNIQTEIPFNESRLEDAAEILHKLEIPNDAVVSGIFLGANPEQIIKQYFPDRFARIAERISEEYNSYVLVFAGPKEKALLKKFKDTCELNPRIKIIEDDHHLLTISAIISLLSYFISADTGIMHLALALKIPTVGIFGSGDWHSYGTYPEEYPFIMVKKEIECWPCETPECQERTCMKNISVEMVMEAYSKLLKAYPSNNKAN